MDIFLPLLSQAVRKLLFSLPCPLEMIEIQITSTKLLSWILSWNVLPSKLNVASSPNSISLPWKDIIQYFASIGPSANMYTSLYCSKV